MKLRRMGLSIAAAIACWCTHSTALAAPGDVVVSSVWGGVSSSTGTANVPRADYVELFNRTASPVPMSGWSIAVSTTTTGTVWAQHNLTGTIQPFSYYLIRVSAEATNGNALPGTDEVFASPSFTALATTAGRAVLRDVITPTISGTACPTLDSHIIDLVAWGTTTTTCREGSANAPAATTTSGGTTPTRAAGGCVDTNENGADFSAVAPNPRWSGSTSSGGCVIAACCNTNTGACTIATAGGCTASGGVFQPDSPACPPIIACPEARACCTASGGCSVLTEIGCTAAGGYYQTDTFACTGSPCATGSCCLADGTCCALFSAACTAQGGTPGAQGISCTAAGNCIAAPSNDTCATAQVIAMAGLPIIGNNFAATTNDGLNTLCATARVSKGVWFSFTPATTSVYDITTCGSTFDCSLGIFQIGNCANVATWSYVACDDDLCPTGSASFCGTTSNASAAFIDDVQLTGGTTYHILLGADSTTATAGGNYTLLVQDQGVVPTGVCCNPVTGQCEIRTQSACEGGLPVGIFQEGTTCSPSPCIVPVGACCFSSVCVLRPESGTGACAAANFQGVGTTCVPEPCITGTCCNTCTFACTITVESACPTSTSTWTEGGTCPAAPSTCVAIAAPDNDSACTATILTSGSTINGQLATATSDNDGFTSTCDTSATKGVWFTFNPPGTGFYMVSTCGATFGSVVTVLTGDCMDPFSMTIVGCDDDTCVGGSTGEPVVCGTATSSTAAAVIPFVYLNVGTTYYVRVQVDGATAIGGSFPMLIMPASAGACCNSATALCTVTTASACTTGVFQGDNTTCTPDPCPPKADVSIAVGTALGNCGAPAGTALHTSYVVTNLGPVDSTNTTVTINVPSAFGFTSSTPSGSPVGGVLTLNLGTIAMGSSVVVSLDGTAAPGFGSVTATVTRDQTDPVASNNTAAAQAVVVGQATPLAAQVLLSDFVGPTSQLPASGSFPGANIAFSAENMTRPFASADGSRWVMSVDTDLATSEDRVLLSGTTTPFTFSVIAREGSTALSLGDLSGEFDYGMGVNNSGQVAWSTTTAGGTATDSTNDVIVRTSAGVHSVVVREGAAATAVGPGVTFAGANAAYGVRTNGMVAFSATLAGTSGTVDDTAVFDNDGALVLAQEGVTVPAGAGATHLTFANLASGNVGQGTTLFGPSGYSIGGTLTGTIDVINLNGNAVIIEGGSVPGIAEAITTVAYNNTVSNGDWLAYGSCATPSATDFCVRNGILLAKTDDPLFPGSTETWDDAVYSGTFFGFVANAAGDYVVAGTVSAPTVSNAVFVVNGQRVLMRENDPIDLNGNGLVDDDAFIGTYRDDRMFLTEDGWLYFVARIRTQAESCQASPGDGNHQALLRIQIHTNVSCCRGTTCVPVAAGACTGTVAGSNATPVASCGAGNSSATCCFADFNHTGGVTIDDLFLYLNAYFTSSPYSNFGGDTIAGPTIDDLFLYINAYFTGCQP